MTKTTDNDLFKEFMGDVIPLKQDTIINRHGQADKQRLNEHRAQLEQENLRHTLPFSFENVPLCQPDDYLEFKKDGVQDGVFRKLRLGKYDIQARLDLHKQNIQQASESLWHFLQQCQKLDARSVLIVHGKGQHLSPPALLKSHIAHWLPTLDDILCFHSAQPRHGGTGATYVLLRKNAQTKSENRERHLNHRA